MWMLELRLQTHMLRSKHRVGLNMELILEKNSPTGKLTTCYMLQGV